LTATLAGLAAFATAQEKPKDLPTFGISTELVYVRFHVARKGSYLDAITKDQVLEDGKPQQIALLETPSTRERTLPPDVTLALDVSSSVLDAGLLDETLIREVFLSGLSEQARVGLCAFGGELRCFVPPTRDVRALLEGLQQALLFGRESRRQGTRLYESLADICKQEKSDAKVQRALVVFSDGLDNKGGKVKDAIEAATAADARVYAVKVSQAFQDTAPTLRAGGGGGFGMPPNRSLYDYKKFDLDKLAAETGGQAYEPGTIDKKSLGTILKSVAKEITMENVVGYQPDGAPTGKKRRIKVELVDRSLGEIKDGERTLVR
jgi:VWFA-related protein